MHLLLYPGTSLNSKIWTIMYGMLRRLETFNSKVQMADVYNKAHAWYYKVL